MVTATDPRWFRPVLTALSALLLMGWFSPEISDSDFWWHLKTGDYIAHAHALPVPDPFAFTTSAAGAAYAGEERTRFFNLTHEWLAQVLFYLVWRVAGFAGVVLARAAVLAGACALVGLLAYRRSADFYLALGAVFAAAGVVSTFAVDRPFVATYLLLMATTAILEFRRPLWLLPPLMLVWANCHGGYFLGWVVLAAYSAEAAMERRRGRPQPGDRGLWVAAAAAIAVSGLNPNGYRIPQILLYYRHSYLTSRLIEWAPPRLWPPPWFAILMVPAAALLLWSRRRARPVDCILLAAFSAAALTAQRNQVLVGLVAPVVIAAYFPWKRALPRIVRLGTAAMVAGALAIGVARGAFFQLRAAEWKYPAGAADFLLAHGIRGPMFNTYEFGGYLMWRLWPQERVFIDGRALSESLFLDYSRILYNHDETGGPSAQQLLDRYGVQTIVMNGFEYNTGNAYLLAPALADPRQNDWKLVYGDAQALVFVRHPPPGAAPQSSMRVLDFLEAGCDLHIGREPEWPRCARSLGQIFARIGDFPRARRWIGRYLELKQGPDREAEEAFQKLMGAP